jgi:hypothetical protein
VAASAVRRDIDPGAGSGRSAANHRADRGVACSSSGATAQAGTPGCRQFVRRGVDPGAFERQTALNLPAAAVARFARDCKRTYVPAG